MRKIKEVIRLKFALGLGLRQIALFGGPPRARPAVLAMPDFADLHQQRQRHPHVTQQLLWEEYRQANPDGLDHLVPVIISPRVPGLPVPITLCLTSFPEQDGRFWVISRIYFNWELIGKVSKCVQKLGA